METNLSAWNSHDWISRRLEVAPGKPLAQQTCRKCGRSFVDESEGSIGRWYAVHVSVFKFLRLADEVTSRWLFQDCPGARLRADEVDRHTRFSGSYLSGVSDVVNGAGGKRIASLQRRGDAN
jgi:hypothetical protein